MTKTKIRIGCSSGFWGDTDTAMAQLVRGGQIDYLVSDYLAEITMSLMARARAKSPQAGYATDFVTAIKPLLAEINKQSIKVLSNAGGVNPVACRDALLAAAAELGLGFKIAVVLGDDLMPMIPALREQGVKEMFSGSPLPEKLASANAYLGAQPIAVALAQGADIVITGRCVDSAVTLAPMLHEFGWRADQYDLLAAGSLAGHIIECGVQGVGGLFTDWEQVPGWDNMGFPIAEIAADGSCVISKPEGTGGLVTPASVAEQIIYEIGDPASYLLPDVVCDFTQVKLTQAGANQVRVEGARGRAPTASYKVSATYADGWKLLGTVMIGGIDAARKAQRVAQAILAKTRRRLAEQGLADFRATDVEVLGAEATYGPHGRMPNSREVVLKIAALHDDKAALEIMAREIAPAATSLSPGITGFAGGRPSPSPVLRLFSFLIDKAAVAVDIEVAGKRTRIAVPLTAASVTPAPAAALMEDKIAAGEQAKAPLIKVAHGRSGDKGNISNIGIIARSPALYAVLRRELTAEKVAAYFSHVARGRVERFDLPGFNALNFVMHEALGGGGIASLRYDPQGKALAQMLLDMEISVPKEVLPH